MMSGGCPGPIMCTAQSGQCCTVTIFGCPASCQITRQEKIWCLVPYFILAPIKLDISASCATTKNYNLKYQTMQ